MPVPTDDLSPDESLRADNQIKLLKLNLGHNVQFADFDPNLDPKAAGEFLDSILALEEVQTNPQQATVYEVIGCPAFTSASDIDDEAIEQALKNILHQMSEHHIGLDILAPDDYDARTIYRFVTEELFAHETTLMGGGWNTNFIYEEFHPNHRYDITKQCDGFTRHLHDRNFTYLDHYLSRRFFDQGEEAWQYVPSSGLIASLTNLLDNWWPYSLQHAQTEVVRVAADAESAEATVVFTLGVDGDTAATRTTEGTIFLQRIHDRWDIVRIKVNDWELS